MKVCGLFIHIKLSVGITRLLILVRLQSGGAAKVCLTYLAVQMPSHTLQFLLALCYRVTFQQMPQVGFLSLLWTISPCASTNTTIVRDLTLNPAQHPCRFDKIPVFCCNLTLMFNSGHSFIFYVAFSRTCDHHVLSYAVSHLPELNINYLAAYLNKSPLFFKRAP